MCGQDRAHNPLLKISKPGFRHIWPLAKLSAQARGHPKSIQSIKLPQIWLTQLLSGSLGTQIDAIFRFGRARAPRVGREILRWKRLAGFKLPGTLNHVGLAIACLLLSSGARVPAAGRARVPAPVPVRARVRPTNATDPNPGPVQPRPHPVSIILPVPTTVQPTTVSTTVQPTNNPTNQPASQPMQAGVANRSSS